MPNLDGLKLAVPSIVTPRGGASFTDFINRKVETCEPLRLQDQRWAFVYSERDAGLVDQIIDGLKKASKGLQMKIEGEPIWVEIPRDQVLEKDGCKNTRNGGNYIFCINNELGNRANQISMAFVLIGNDKFHGPIKRHLDGLGVVSQFLLFKNIQKKVGTMGVLSNLLRQVNVKCGLDNYRIKVPPKLSESNTMFVGLEVVNAGRKSIVGLSSTYDKHMMQHFSGVAYQEMHKEMLKNGWTKEEQEAKVC